MVAGFPREAIESGRGSGNAPLTLFGREVVLPNLKRPVVAAAITVGIALTSKPS
jgi:hypothetical protein